MNNHYEVAVIGGGPSGMMAAITAARKGLSVCVLEHKERVGNKILITGNGKCNLTNRVMKEDCFRSDSGTGFFHVIEAFDETQLIQFFEGLGIYIHEKNGYIYPASEQAATILDGLRFEMERLHIDVITNCSLQRITGHFLLITSQGNLTADKLVLACGSKANAKTGSDGSGYQLAKYFGHSVVRPIPALTQLKCAGDFWKEISGVRIQARLSVTSGTSKEIIRVEEGELQIADYGISGIPTFIISRTVGRMIEQQLYPEIHIHFAPQFEESSLRDMITRICSHNRKLIISEALNGLLPKKLAVLICKQSGIKPTKVCEDISALEQDSIYQNIINYKVKPYDTTGFDHAQVCAGGVSLSEIEITSMESKLVKGLYFCGEILDVDGICGGYNLQWAFSSGYVAGSHCSM